ncbi:MAG: aspartyl/glutamyl-tRNA amidotransferase subunit A [Candidatus Jacksonbacteria bacterium RIFOXYC2_FULL_44_29]|nr:MAG: Glutamyl-tRNA(Gln) amidotransferase subunit A [Parcubacteria group bacterium GW2011_GWA2_42_28]KKT55849.1 MAG: Glutamyl-tRNA(Gln) amidotransferase subunit A [Parcubacteria group bacterium GW2011_GWC2_44_22]OGY75627.1 MAG: aspartyl/glutamyl-tRNA amidotransferase subunit A [Candidatus Jacksonbacteria bacterium RIFOXYA2_FULL_43_12]OGY76600.1 MAG: aspartyl/glutamyl-tRNA amidotransferase subunit A [Candidatus Jacksonbacteria bacterium RIFOXYB2_FULL_44_15]OGY78325.1 MAG: aspartyl/glutamyl-tRN
MIKELHNKLETKQISTVELARQYLAQIDKLDPRVRAYLKVTSDLALKQASMIDKKIASGEEVSVLAGIPAAVKDIIATAGVTTTAASRILENYVPPFDATVIKQLKAKDFVMLGKTNLDEFAHGASTENSSFWPTHNPWDLERVPGGSSGGSAAAVSAGMAAYALGTDTGGSIRQPASFCGIVGFKPTYGRCSRYGLLAMTSSTDVPGFFTSSVEDAAIVLAALAGVDPRDATTLPVSVPDYLKAVRDPKIKGLRIGLPQEYFIPGMDREVEQAVRKAITDLERQGAVVKEVSLPYSKYGVAVYYVVTPSEVSSNLGRYDGIRYGLSYHDQADNLFDVYQKTRGAGFGPEAKRRIMIGTFALSSGYYDAYYKKAQQVRSLIIRDFEHVFAEVDVLMVPTSPGAAFKIGEKANDPLAMYLEDVFLVPASLAGLPAISIPCGFTSKKLPIGMQIIGPQLGEEKILEAAAFYEGLTDWHKTKPPIS